MYIHNITVYTVVVHCTMQCTIVKTYIGQLFAKQCVLKKDLWGVRRKLDAMKIGSEQSSIL